MPEITEGVYHIPGRDEMIPDAHVYVIGKPESEDLTMVDAGLMGKGEYKIQTVRDLGIDPTHIKRVLMTHTHLDHIGCLSEIRRALPQAALWVHAEEAEPLEKGDEKTVYGMDMFRSMCQMQYGLADGAFTFPVDRKLQGGETLNIGNMSWDVLHVPGHSIGCIALYHPRKKILIPGDVVYADHAIGRFDLHLADGRTLRDSLVRLGELDVEVLLPGHNRVDTHVPPGYIQKTAEQWAPYLS